MIGLAIICKKWYRAFFKKLQKERDDLSIVTFDCQKNFVLAKIQDQIAYYSCLQFVTHGWKMNIGKVHN